MGDIRRRFDIKAKPTRWLGFFIDCRFNWQAHVGHRLALGHYRIKATARVTDANGVQRKLARKVAWAGPSPCSRPRMASRPFGKASSAPGRLRQTSLVIGRTVAGTFSTAKGEDAIHAADIPPTRPALDRRRERLLASALAAPPRHTEASAHPTAGHRRLVQTANIPMVPECVRQWEAPQGGSKSRMLLSTATTPHTMDQSA